MLGKNEWKLVPGIRTGDAEPAYALMRRKWLFWHVFRWSTDKEALLKIVAHMSLPVVYY